MEETIINNIITKDLIKYLSNNQKEILTKKFIDNIDEDSIESMGILEPFYFL